MAKTIDKTLVCKDCGKDWTMFEVAQFYGCNSFGLNKYLHEEINKEGCPECLTFGKVQ